MSEHESGDRPGGPPRAARPIRSVSVLMPTWQGMEFLPRVLDALAAQRLELPWTFRVVDSGSTDGTWEEVGERERSFPVPVARERIHQVEFDHGDTRNLLAARSDGDLLVFLTQDAIPSSPDWLATLVRNFDDPTVGAAYCRNVPRPDARALTKVFSAGDPGYAAEGRVVRLPDAATYAAMDPHARRLLYNFNDVASAVRRELWERHPFPRTPFGEDVLMARAVLEAGFGVAYDAEATVEHSHDYDPDETRKRAEIDARFNAEWLGRVCVGSRKDAATLTDRLAAEDARALAALDVGDAERAALEREGRALRAAAFEGLWAGGRTDRRRPRTRMRDRTDVRILYVVHGFPPDTWAGTEVYTLNLAREMQRRGHRVTILTRAPAAGDEPDFSVREDAFEDLRVLRLTHRLEHADLRESYSQPKAEAAFRRVLAAERPDLVHFQHLIHTSVGLVDVAREAGCATVVTCHDYWALCARVQMIRPDGAICPSNMGSGCFLCVKERGLEHVERAKRLDGTLGAGRVLETLATKVAGWNVGGEGAVRRASEYRDLRAREDVVPAAYAAADLRISPSRFLREKLLESGRFDPHAFVFSDNGMRTDHVEALEKRPDPEGRVRFGFIGTLVWYKGGETLVRAMNRLAGAEAVLHVWGGFDPDGDEHHRFLRDLATAGNVEFHGRFDNSRLSEVYADVDVLVVPSLWYENSPITIHEAHLTRTPVVTSDVGGMAEYVRDGVDGLHFRLGDDEDLAKKLRRFVDEPGLVAELSRDFPPIKSIEENAEETEFRYRALCCVERAASEPRGPLVEATGAEACAARGAADRQGADYLLLRPGAAADWDLAGAPAGPARLELEVVALGAEPDLELGGVARVDGREVGVLPAFRSAGDDESRVVALDVELPADAERLTLEAAGGLHLRVARVRVLRRAERPRAAEVAS